MRILLATANPNKVREVKAILGPQGIELDTLADLPDPPPEPVEDADTFEGNARIKARA